MILLINFLFLIIYTYLLVSSMYFLFFAIAGLICKPKLLLPVPAIKKIAVLIPAYKEDEIIFDTVSKACNHDYPADLFRVIVVADSLSKKTVDALRQLPATILEQSFEVSTKARSVHAGLQYLSNQNFDVVVLLDADNLMGEGFLQKINAAFCNGCLALQCQRLGKNEQTPVSLLGSVSEAININIFRRGQTALGLSAAPLGSAMAFTFDLIRDIFDSGQILDSAGEDREIDMQLLKKGISLEFTDDAFAYDEKVSSTKVFENQRIRWFEAQYNQARHFFSAEMRRVPITPVYINRLIQTLLLPRLLYFVVFCMIFVFFTLQWAFKSVFMFPEFLLWVLCLGLYLLALVISVPARFFNLSLVKAILYIPALMFSMIKAVLKMKRNRVEFLHTPKSVNQK